MNDSELVSACPSCGTEILRSATSSFGVEPAFVFPVAFDPATQVLHYRVKDNLHWRDLQSGLDLVIAHYVWTASARWTTIAR